MLNIKATHPYAVFSVTSLKSYLNINKGNIPNILTFLGEMFFGKGSNRNIVVINSLQIFFDIEKK